MQKPLFLDERDFEDGARPSPDYVYDFDEMPPTIYLIERQAMAIPKRFKDKGRNLN